MTRKICFFTGIFMLAFSCRGPEKLLSDDATDKIYFGNYGGFTNIPMDYVLFEKGQLYKIKNDSLLKVHKISTAQNRDLEGLLKNTELEKLVLNEPGNITYYIKVVKSGSEHTYKWSDTTENKVIKELYQALLATIKKD